MKESLMDYHGIQIDISRDRLLSEQAMQLLQDYYMLPGESSPQEAYARAALAYCNHNKPFAQRIYDYASKGWFMFASPVLSNAPRVGEYFKALPISCFLTYIGDNLTSLVDHNAEVAWLSVKGGGVGGHWSDVRGVSDKAPGPIPFMKVVDSQMTAYKQGKTRKGSYAAYLDINHPDIVEFINFKVPTGGDINRKCFNLFNAVNVTDKFMEAVEKDLEWHLIDPANKDVRGTIKARDLWQRILEARFRTGSPYINFIDEANRQLNPQQKALGLKVHGSNLCNEIHLATSEDRTAVCCLSSVNLEKFDDWVDTDMVYDLTVFLDNVLQAFIDNAPREIHKAIRSAEAERSLGLGAMGFHGYLQSKGIPFEGLSAKIANIRMFKHIKAQATKATQTMARTRGEPSDLIGTGTRNAHLIAVAPNANSSIICGCSASIEPIKSNAYVHRTRAGSHLVKNVYLQKILYSMGKDTQEVWQSIIMNEGSIQHLDFIDKTTKDIYKTAFEIDQTWVIEHAADRQQFICQGQSLNLFFPAGSPKSYVNAVHLRAWKSKLKGLYYLRTSAGVQADKIGLKIERNALQDAEECLSCHG
jgi:ribonucleoside-diphosphate reductase alpha chain